MPFIMVQTYTLTLITNSIPPGSYIWNIVLNPLPNVGLGSGVNQAEIIHRSDTGIQNGSATGSPLNINVFAGTSQFEVHRNILQTEAPVYFNWNTSPGNPQEVYFFYLSTGAEPPGEGPADTSP
jgi:hypothetical protein